MPGCTASLDVVAAWKEVLLVPALAVAFLGARYASAPLGRPARARLRRVRRSVLVLPQSWLREATQRGQLFAARHDLIPVAAYFLGRLLVLTPVAWRRLSLMLVAVAVGLTVWGLADVYLVPPPMVARLRGAGLVRRAARARLQRRPLATAGELDLNTGDEDNPVDASSHVPQPSRDRLRARDRAALPRCTQAGVVDDPAAAVAYAGLLWTHTRAAYLALAIGLVVLAAAQRRFFLSSLAAASLLVGVGFVKAFPQIGPSTSYTQAELEILRDRGELSPEVSDDPLSGGDASTASHLRNLRDGIGTVLRHPQGFGLGNAGVNASRTGVEIKAGESTYTELGVEIGLAGLVAFCGWLAAVLAALWGRSAWLSAAWVAMLAIAVQTDVIGVHWVAYVLFALAGVAIGGGLPDDEVPDA